MLDRSVAETLASSDGSRPVIPHSGVWPHLPQLSGTSTHLWAGWRWGRTSDLARLLRWWPRLGRFVAEFGAQAPAGDGALLDVDGDAADRWPDLDWAELSDRFALELGPIRQQVPPEHHGSLAAWAAAAQDHQADGSCAVTSRRSDGSSTGRPEASPPSPSPTPRPARPPHCSTTDRRPKPAWDAFVAACAPVVGRARRAPRSCASARPPRPRPPRRQRSAHSGRAPAGRRSTLAWAGREDEPFHRGRLDGRGRRRRRRPGRHASSSRCPLRRPTTRCPAASLVVTVTLSDSGVELDHHTDRRALQI